ncbi:hypothetical protein K437DRAFT_253929 [Tilletiaria anomala UBC 951]|uniref:Cation efflux protein transmembrane domain-containing protein n=1 Tax=Tilletiaria anomala (strain ATCC 24038 / CBS 436.72 / UBC 951) TaxID=1037660 RepID=A0A066WJK0_TILAU|nr:uncharacterized protein K437DRAFT_253929 [Tilletiaria anomala UBC 951]KDN52733.1 hypothetical protein K437DRAFT_253929 [Tilletiaria anomala UBC 951]
MVSAAAYSDPRTRGRVKIESSSDGIGFGGTSGVSRIPTDLLLGQVFTKTLLASSALLARHWLLMGHSEALHHATTAPAASVASKASGGLTSLTGSMVRDGSISVWAVATIVFSIASLIQGIWLRTWTWLPVIQRADAKVEKLLPKFSMLALTMFVHMLVWLMALKRLPAATVIIFTQFCEIWASDLVKSMRGRSYGGYTVLVALGLSYIFTVAKGTSAPTSFDHISLFADDDDEDIPVSLQRIRSAGLVLPSALGGASALAEKNAALFSPSSAFLGHVLLLMYALLTLEKERGTNAAGSVVGGRRRAQVIAGTLTAIVTLPLGLLGSIFGLSTLPPLQSLAPYLFASSQSGVRSAHLAAYVLLALAALVLEPLITGALEPHGSAYTRVFHGWMLCAIGTIVIGYIGFAVRSSFAEVFVGALVCWSLAMILSSSPYFQANAYRQAGASDASLAGHQRSPSDASALAGLARSVQDFFSASQKHIRSILANPDSRSIFQFLCLNLAFMGVQLAWGVWTNSLGLISDAIHMFFDCAAIGMGLFASVMATWKTDSSFTFGYSRVETLSGFANGVFLILISIFIVFEAIQRIIEPPEMHNTMQLLIVSGMGLGVNLFGMFAMGGHHHHHHGHSHGHGHDHHHHGHGHDHGHGHGHSHNMMGVYLHVMADTLGSVGVIVSTLLIKQFGWTGFDPIASLFIAFLIVASVIPLVLDAGHILCLDMGDEKGQQVATALGNLASIKGVASYSSPRFWPKDAESIVGTIHIQVVDSEVLSGKGGITAEQIAAEVEQVLKGRIEGLESISVQVDRQPQAQSSQINEQTTMPQSQLHPHPHQRHSHSHNNGSVALTPEAVHSSVF